MPARVLSATPWGLEALPVEVEVDVRCGLPQMQIVGMPDTSVRESRERVRAAVKNCGFDLQPRHVVVNLAPADLRKIGNHLDLAIALCLLAAHAEVPPACLEGRMLVGELGLDGTLRSVRGGLAIAELGLELGLREILVPAGNAREAAAVTSLPVIPVGSLDRALGHLLGKTPIPRQGVCSVRKSPSSVLPDLAEVRGQESAKRALEIAAAGGHNLLLVGPPGSGKTMLARRLPGILPPLSRPESAAVTRIHSMVAGRPPDGLISVRPFRSPHTSVSTAGLIGGGRVTPQPGEVTLAHHGVLFLDELPEFRRDALEALRQPLEDGVVSIARVMGQFVFPARFSLVAAMNPCKCGHLGDPRHDCRCAPHEVERYRRRISGPLLDRIDMHVEVPAVRLDDLRGKRGEPSEMVAERVEIARRVQRFRFGPKATDPVNANMSESELRRHSSLEEEAQKLLDTAYERLGLSVRARARILKVARTIADLSRMERIHATHIAEAIQYRSLDRRGVS